MARAKQLPLSNKQPITIEEYRQLKRRLLSLHCQYVKLAYSQSDKYRPSTRLARLRKLERRMAELELTLAGCKLDEFEREPDIFDAIGSGVRHLVMAVWHETRHWRQRLLELRSRTKLVG